MNENEDCIEQSMIEAAFESRLIIRLFLGELKDRYQLEQCGISRSETIPFDSEAYNCL